MVHPQGGDLISSFLQRGRYWQPKQIEYIVSHVSPMKPNFFDLGTNIGTESVPVAKYVKALGGQVLGIDATPPNAALGVANLELNGVDSAVILNRAVVADTRGTPVVSISWRNWNRGGAEIGDSARDQRQDQEHQVGTVSVDELFAMDEGFLCGVDVWKLDIQGSEGLAFQGASAWLARCPPCFISTELWPEALRRRGVPFGPLADQLRGLGYEFYHNGTAYRGRGEEFEGRYVDVHLVHRSCSAEP